MSHVVGTRSGAPRKEPGTTAEVGGGGETERMESPSFLLMQGSIVSDDLILGTPGTENTVPLAVTAQPSPVIVACTLSSPCPLPPAGRHRGAGGMTGGEERPHPRWGPWL